jgi:hypothetical protein
MTIQEFLDTYLPTRLPKAGDRQLAWAGWIANLYLAVTGNEMTLAEVWAAMETAGYEDKSGMFAVSKAELGRVDRRFSEKMVRNRKDGKGV